MRFKCLAITISHIYNTETIAKLCNMGSSADSVTFIFLVSSSLCQGNNSQLSTTNYSCWQHNNS